MMMTDSVLAQVAALKTTPTPELKQRWRELFDTPPPLTIAASWKAGSLIESRNWPTAG